ncbi:MAG: hypothetical protein KIT69_05800 [Propionibacteriaceae bacterium]|nr:hypothetical protein [Propionibacteriaceae bacterium]
MESIECKNRIFEKDSRDQDIIKITYLGPVEEHPKYKMEFNIIIPKKNSDKECNSKDKLKYYLFEDNYLGIITFKPDDFCFMRVNTDKNTCVCKNRMHTINMRYFSGEDINKILSWFKDFDLE